MKPAEHDLKESFQSCGLMPPDAHPEMTFDWPRWHERLLREPKPRPRRTWWLAAAALFFAALVGVPSLVKPSAASSKEESPREMGRIIALRLGDPYASRFTWTKTAQGFVISGTSYNEDFFPSVAAALEHNGYTSFHALVGTKGTEVTLTFGSGALPTKVVRLGPAPDFRSRAVIFWPSGWGPGGVRVWADRLAFFSGHPHARATATLTTMAGAGLSSPLIAWLTGNPSAVLLSLKDGRWHRQYAISLAGGIRVPSDRRVAGYHFSFGVVPPTESARLSSAAEAKILVWARRRWGAAVTGFRYAELTAAWASDLSLNNVNQPALEVQFASPKGLMPSPVLFSTSGRELFWVQNWHYGDQALSGGVPGGFSRLSNAFPPISQVPDAGRYGVIPTFKVSGTAVRRPFLHWAPGIAPPPFLHTRLHQVRQLLMAWDTPIDGVLVEEVRVLTHTQRTWTLRLIFRVTPGMWGSVSGAFEEELVWHRNAGGWRLQKTRGPIPAKAATR